VFRDATLADGVLEKNLTLDEFPSPQELGERSCAWKGWTPAVRQVTEFENTPFPPPPLAEQSRIVTRINELRSLCVDLRARLETVQFAQTQLSKTLVVS
jgi:hypothetical protein